MEENQMEAKEETSRSRGIKRIKINADKKKYKTMKKEKRGN